MWLKSGLDMFGFFFGKTPVVKTVIPEETKIDIASFTRKNGILALNGGILPQPI